MPYQINGFKGDSTNRATFTDFNTAVSHIAGYDGIGIGVFDDICAIVIDHCVENGQLSDMAEELLRAWAAIPSLTRPGLESGFCLKRNSAPMTQNAIT